MLRLVRSAAAARGVATCMSPTLSLRRRVRAEVNADHQWGLGPEDNKLLDASELAVSTEYRVTYHMSYGD